MGNIDSIIDGFSRYISKSESEEFLRDHDSRFDGLRKAIKDKSEKLKPPINVIAPRLYYVADHVFYCIQLFEYKYYLLAKGMLNGLQDNNPLSLANNCRSLLEQVATLHYCMQAVEEMLDSLKDQGSLEKINQIISKAEKVLQRTYAGQGRKDPTKQSFDAIHVNTAIQKLEKKIDDAMSAYDYLCEFVHPNFGNNSLISFGEIGKGIIKSKENSDETIIKIASIGLNLLNFSSNVQGQLYPILTWRAHHLVELCLIKGAKITNIFSTKKPSPEGNGETKETAFFFKNARTSQEAMDLSYQYLREAGYKNLTPLSRTNGGIAEEGEKLFIYDVWNTGDRDIWFKIPSYMGI